MGRYSETELKNRSLDELKAHYISLRFKLKDLDPRSKEGKWLTRSINLIKEEVLKRGLKIEETLGRIDEELRPNTIVPTAGPPLHTNGDQPLTTAPKPKPKTVNFEWSIKDAYNLMKEMEKLELEEESELHQLLVELKEGFERALEDL